MPGICVCQAASGRVEYSVEGGCKSFWTRCLEQEAIRAFAQIPGMRRSKRCKCPHRTVERRPQERRSQSFAADIRQQEPELATVERDEIVIVAAHTVGGAADGRVLH